MNTPTNCTAHPFRPGSVSCKKCGKGICSECNKLYRNLCPQCAGIYVVNKHAVRGMTVVRAKEGKALKDRKWADFSLPTFPKSAGGALPTFPKGVRGALAAFLLVSLVALVGFGFFGRGPFPYRRRPPTDTEVRRASLMNLNLAVTSIAAYQSRTGMLPTTLDQIGLGFDRTLGYQVVSPSRYLLTSTRGTLAITYDSKEDPAKFFMGVPSVVNPAVTEAR